MPASGDVEIIELNKSYQNVIALKNVSLRAEKGKVTVIAGPSGSGKTTLLRIIAGLEDPDSGDVRIAGHSVLGVPPWKRRAIMLTQKPVLLPHLTVRRNIMVAAEAQGASREESRVIAESIGDRLGISDVMDRLPGSLSGGQLQRASLAAILAARPKVLLLDEPFAHLDLPLRESLRRLVREIASTWNIPIIQVTHDQDEALEIADSLAILINGEIHGVGDPLLLYHHPPTLKAAWFLGHNVLCSPPLSKDGTPVSFPPEAVELGAPGFKGEIVYVATRKHYTLVFVRVGEQEVRGVLPGVRRLSHGPISFSVREEFIANWPGDTCIA